jgi:hypothetical protein
VPFENVEQDGCPRAGRPLALEQLPGGFLWYWWMLAWAIAVPLVPAELVAEQVVLAGEHGVHAAEAEPPALAEPGELRPVGSLSRFSGYRCGQEVEQLPPTAGLPGVDHSTQAEHAALWACQETSHRLRGPVNPGSVTHPTRHLSEYFAERRLNRVVPPEAPEAPAPLA